jgi:uncharacterized membrane protein YjfL (UPF0719 family)
MKIYKIENDNTAFAIFQVGIIFSGSLILSSIISPALNATRFLNPDNTFTLESLLHTYGYITMFVFIGFFCAILVISSGLFVLFNLTKIDEGQEIKNNNIAVALITAAIIIFIGFYTSHLFWYWIGAFIFIGMLIYQHSIVKPNDLSKVNIAFMTANGIASILFACFVIIDILIKIK